jgi:hypothetical protein
MQGSQLLTVAYRIYYKLIKIILESHVLITSPMGQAKKNKKQNYVFVKMKIILHVINL